MGIRGSGVSARAARGAAALTLCVVLANCAASDKFSSRVDPKYGVSSSPRVVDFGEPVPKGGGTYRVGKPYTVAGREYVPFEDTHYRAEGLASWYGDDFHGRLTANGEVFDMMSLTAAHPTLPMPCYARVTNLGNGKSVIVRVNDRGPYHGNRLIDVSHNAARLLDFKSVGIARVRVEYVGRAPLEGSDDRLLEATLRTGEPAPPPSSVRIASARPFISETTASGRPVRGDVPLPEDRPYTLGNAPQDVASRGEGRLPEDFRTATYDANSTVPVSAYAPVGAQQDGIAALLSGRGLY
ncbi:MAG: septal ring lytic transglycosylase RlpA family protein [Xanthobacteraceae bacterium]